MRVAFDVGQALASDVFVLAPNGRTQTSVYFVRDGTF